MILFSSGSDSPEKYTPLGFATGVLDTDMQETHFWIVSLIEAKNFS